MPAKRQCPHNEITLRCLTTGKVPNNPMDDNFVSTRVCGYTELLALAGYPDQTAQISNGSPAYPGPFRLCETTAAVLAAIGTLVCEIWRDKTGHTQQATVETRTAAAALNSYAFLQCKNTHGQYKTLSSSLAAISAYSITRPFYTHDNRWFLPHFGLLHLKSRMQQLLDCDATPEAVAAAIANHNADKLEEAVASIGACGGVIRSASEWLEHPQGRALASRPVIEIEKIADSAPKPFSNTGPALHGIRILDLTRILAGPVAARTCAEHGADVLMVSAKHTPQIKNFVIDLSHGKRSCFLDLNRQADASQLRTLVSDTDVFSQGYRPGVLAARGFGPHDLAAICPGVIYLSTSCYGQHGPWKNRAGWEQVAQAVTGICHRNDPEQPALLPVNACDYLTGYLGAYGILLALLRRSREGGSYHVNVSLCQSAMFLNRQPSLPETPVVPLSDNEIESLKIQTRTPYGSLRHLAPAVNFSKCKAQWLRPSPALGGDQPLWLDPVYSRD